MAKKAARTIARSHKLSHAPHGSAGVNERSDSSHGLLVAVELGADWPSLAFDLPSNERRVLVQLEGESPAAFADRVSGSLDSLFGRGVELRALALACNERLDSAADEARRSLVGLALGSMAQKRAGKVYLTAAPQSTGRLRVYLTALAEGSRTEWHNAGLEVAVDFGRELSPTRANAVRARVA